MLDLNSMGNIGFIFVVSKSCGINQFDILSICPKQLPYKQN